MAGTATAILISADTDFPCFILAVCAVMNEPINTPMVIGIIGKATMPISIHNNPTMPPKSMISTATIAGNAITAPQKKLDTYM